MIEYTKTALIAADELISTLESVLPENWSYNAALEGTITLTIDGLNTIRIIKRDAGYVLQVNLTVRNTGRLGKLSSQKGTLSHLPSTMQTRLAIIVRRVKRHHDGLESTPSVFFKAAELIKNTFDW